MKNSKYIGIAMMAAGLLAATSCSDFDDYNKAVADVTTSGNQALWENIQQNPQLSDFAALVQKAGFAENLNTTHYYTVWAPLNGTFDAAAFQSLGNSALLKQFVQNHIADYGHNASGSIDERVLMLNEKSYAFEGSGSYTFDGVALAQANLPSNNGVMHTLNGVATFYPNLYEYATDASLSEGKELDSLRNYFQKYEVTYLDENASVIGSIVNGMQTYVDSVMVTENALWYALNVEMLSEDSTYTFLMPTNDAWAKTYNRIKSYYRYIPTTRAQAFVSSGGSVAISTEPASITIDPAYWQDSLTNRNLTRNLAYSNNDGYNRWLSGEASALGADTLRSTTRNKLSNPREILAQTRETVKMSNGVVRIVDSLAFYPWETYVPERTFSATSNNNQARILTGNTHVVAVNDPDPTKVETEDGSFRYLWVEPNGGYAKPELDLYLPNVLSTTYEFYCVFVPRSVSLENAGSVTLPNRVIFTLNYCDENGTLKEHEFLNETEENISAFQEQFKLTDNATNRTTIRAFSNDTSKVDTLYLGDFTFPVCYYGLGNEYCPNIKITSPFSVFNRNLMAAYSRDLRIAAIILRPKELVEFEESNKQ